MLDVDDSRERQTLYGMLIRTSDAMPPNAAMIVGRDESEAGLPVYHVALCRDGEVLAATFSEAELRRAMRR